MTHNKKEIVLLSLLNKILENSNHPNITNIKEFRIEREELILPQNTIFLESQYDTIFTLFSKDTSHYRRASAKYYIVILLRSLCKQVGLNLQKKMKDKGIVIGNNKFRKKVTTYLIE